jgi:hypothetical protein
MKPKSKRGPQLPQTERKFKLIPSPERWHPCYNQILDLEGDFVSGDVQVSIIHYLNGNTPSRVIITDFDDSFMELTATKEHAQIIYDALDICPGRNSLVNFWGFNY